MSIKMTGMVWRTGNQHMPAWPLTALLMSGLAGGGGQAGEAASDEAVELSPGAAIASASGGGGLRPLSSEPVPQPTGGHIVDPAAAVRLGKALFWDIQTGGDGRTACASCHFLAGADDRRLDALHPGPDGVFASGGVTGPGQLFAPGDLVNDDRVGSQGVAAAQFSAIDPDPTHAADLCVANPGTLFGAQRQVTGRNAPTVVGAVFFRDAFWDGRANHVFNGVD